MMVTVDEFFAALRSSHTLLIESHVWLMQGCAVDEEWFEQNWEEVEQAFHKDASLGQSVKTVTFLDDGHYEHPKFLSFFDQMEQLVLYGNTLISELGHLAQHPSLKRVALTHYNCLSPASGLAWMDDVPGLEELIIFGEYMEIYDAWKPGDELCSRLRSLWMTWRNFKYLSLASFDALEMLTLELADFESIMEKARKDAKDEGVQVDDIMRRHFQAYDGRDGFIFRILTHELKHKEQGKLFKEACERWLPEGSTVEFYWEPDWMPLLNGDRAFMNHNLGLRS